MKIYQFSVILCFCLFGYKYLPAQSALSPLNNKINHTLTLGYNIGASTPFSLPNTIREIKKYSPLFTPSVGYEATYDLGTKWFLGTGIRLDMKGMKVVDSVQYFHTIITVDNDSGEKGVFEGDFSGTNTTSTRNTYLTVPVFGGYRAQAWDFRLGLYLAYLLHGKFEGYVADGYIRKGDSLGEKVLIDKANFDFGDQVRSWDWGAHLHVGRNICSQWQVSLSSQIGAQPIFASSFNGVGHKLYNLYLTAGVSYKLRR